jgi:hypothetical protein
MGPEVADTVDTAFIASLCEDSKAAALLLLLLRLDVLAVEAQLRKPPLFLAASGKELVDRPGVGPRRLAGL